MVGSVIPGSTVILALSALVPGGELRWTGSSAAAVAGAMLGDGLAFWTGHLAQRKILGAWPIAQLSARRGAERGVLRPLGRARGFFARFVPPICAFVPIMAGALGMPPALLRRRYSGDPVVGAGTCAAGCIGGLRCSSTMAASPAVGGSANITGCRW